VVQSRPKPEKSHSIRHEPFLMNMSQNPAQPSRAPKVGRAPPAPEVRFEGDAEKLFRSTFMEDTVRSTLLKLSSILRTLISPFLTNLRFRSASAAPRTPIAAQPRPPPEPTLSSLACISAPPSTPSGMRGYLSAE